MLRKYLSLARRPSPLFDCFHFFLLLQSESESFTCTKIQPQKFYLQKRSKIRDSDALIKSKRVKTHTQPNPSTVKFLLDQAFTIVQPIQFIHQQSIQRKKGKRKIGKQGNMRDHDQLGLEFNHLPLMDLRKGR